ncbi:unnamed protein product [Lactuca saligna]|uniref:Uncharacterized protein n=1 Tax=Lactuca saligna TaxID=75948 RepID=A0AA36ELV6_LACSI|nr:unnamed protein product [Lactuca saligna]
MASQSSTGKYLTVDVHYNGVFARNPLKYLDLEKITVRDVDFGGFTYKEFLLWLRNLTNGSCDSVYYCSRKETLGEDGNWYDLDDNEEEDGNEEEDHKEEEDDNNEDDNLDDIMAYEHEVDEEVHTFNKIVGDNFLNKLSGKLSDDDQPNDGKDDKVVFHVHDENQEWDKMVPILGKVKVEWNQEVDVESDSDSEVQREPDSEVESYEVDFEEEQVEALVEVEVEEGEYQAAVVDQVEVEAEGQGDGQEGEELEVLQDPVGQDDQGQAAVQDPVEDEHMMELPAFQVLQGKRRSKPSERITKIQIRKK